MASKNEQVSQKSATAWRIVLVVAVVALVVALGVLLTWPKSSTTEGASGQAQSAVSGIHSDIVKPTAGQGLVVEFSTDT